MLRVELEALPGGHCGASVVAQTGLAVPVLLVNAPAPSRSSDPGTDVDAAQRRFRWLSPRISAAEALPARKDPNEMRSAYAGESGRVTNDAPRMHAAGKKHAGLLTPRSQVHVAPPINPDNDHRQSSSQYAIQGYRTDLANAMIRTEGHHRRSDE